MILTSLLIIKKSSCIKIGPRIMHNKLNCIIALETLRLKLQLSLSSICARKSYNIMMLPILIKSFFNK